MKQKFEFYCIFSQKIQQYIWNEFFEYVDIYDL
jgi:hypothetical protein